MGTRIQKYLAACGHGSRREVERWIQAGRLTVNGQPATVGMPVGARDQITLDGKSLAHGSAPSDQMVLLYHKPVGEVCTRQDPEGRPTVFDRLPPPPAGRWVMVGRLDINTSGLLLFTTDGALANQLMHPRYGVRRVYAVRVRGHVTSQVISTLTTGVELEDGPAQFEQVKPRGGPGQNPWFHVWIREGRNREVRRLWESQGMVVSRLIRIAYGSYELPRHLAPGQFEFRPVPQKKQSR